MIKIDSLSKVSTFLGKKEIFRGITGELQKIKGEIFFFIKRNVKKKKKKVFRRIKRALMLGQQAPESILVQTNISRK